MPPFQEHFELPTAWPIPKLLLQVNDLSSPGSTTFFEHVNPTIALRDAVLAVFTVLYTVQTVPKHVRSVTLILREMDGVAFSKGSDLDNDHKEIHFSTKHIQNSKARAKDEILGVITHEMVHCFQYDGLGTCPRGLIEGVADFVRLKAGLAPPHWRKGGNRWDEGYQTTGYFLDWVNERYGEGTVRDLNESLRDKQYSEEIFKTATGRHVDKLWNLYKASLEVPPRP